MKQLARLLLALAFGLTCQKARASDSDPWLGPDKALHFGVTAALALGGYAGSSPWLEARRDRAIVGGSVALTLGVGKELWDLSGHGDPSFRDLAWDVLGTAAGLALAVGIDSLVRAERGTPAQSSAGPLVFHF